MVTCEEDLQLQRLMEIRGLSERDAKLMIAAQMPLEDKARRAQYVVENSGALSDTEESVREIHAELSSSRFHWRVRLAVAAAFAGVVALLYAAAKGVSAGTRKLTGGGGGGGSGAAREL